MKKTKTLQPQPMQKPAEKKELPKPEDKPRPQESGYRSFRLQKSIKAETPKLTGGLKLLLQSLTILKQHWKPFLGIVGIYGILNIVLVQNFAQFNMEDARAALDSAKSGHWDEFLGGLSLFAYLVGSSTTTHSQAAGTYQLILLLVASLALVWALRQAYGGEAVRLRDAFYRGMHPLVPFFLVLLVVVLQLLPMLIGTFLYGFVGSAGPVSQVELLLWIVAIFALSVLSLYLVCSSLFALYIVCLPDMTPMVALRSARTLVRYRRWLVMRRILLLPIVLFVVGGLIMLPVIMFLTPVAVWVFFLLTVLALPVAHSYMYTLYRELL